VSAGSGEPTQVTRATGTPTTRITRPTSARKPPPTSEALWPAALWLMWTVMGAPPARLVVVDSAARRLLAPRRRWRWPRSQRAPTSPLPVLSHRAGPGEGRPPTSPLPIVAHRAAPADAPPSAGAQPPAATVWGPGALPDESDA